jgi:hypothetical protein
MKSFINLPLREITLAYCNPPIGAFAVEKEGRLGRWDHCREQFAVLFDEKIKEFYFSHKTETAEPIAAFISRFEDILKQSNNHLISEKTQFAYTSHNNIIMIQISDFWKDCFFKRSLFTLILRSGQNYVISADNFDDALFSPNFKESSNIYETKTAVLRFMFGYTKYTGISPSIGTATVIKHGWKEEFCKLTVDEIRNRLVWPDGSPKLVNIVGCDSLWS